MGRGGDGYAMFAGAPRLIDSVAGKLSAAQVIEAIAAAGDIAPRVEGRIVPARLSRGPDRPARLTGPRELPAGTDPLQPAPAAACGACASAGSRSLRSRAEKT